MRSELRTNNFVLAFMVVLNTLFNRKCEYIYIRNIRSVRKLIALLNRVLA